MGEFVQVKRAREGSSVDVADKDRLKGLVGDDASPLSKVSNATRIASGQPLVAASIVTSAQTASDTWLIRCQAQDANGASVNGARKFRVTLFDANMDQPPERAIGVAAGPGATALTSNDSRAMLVATSADGTFGVVITLLQNLVGQDIHVMLDETTGRSLGPVIETIQFQ